MIVVTSTLTSLEITSPRSGRGRGGYDPRSLTSPLEGSYANRYSIRLPLVLSAMTLRTKIITDFSDLKKFRRELQQISALDALIAEFVLVSALGHSNQGNRRCLLAYGYSRLASTRSEYPPNILAEKPSEKSIRKMLTISVFQPRCPPRRAIAPFVYRSANIL